MAGQKQNHLVKRWSRNMLIACTTPYLLISGRRRMRLARHDTSLDDLFYSDRKERRIALVGNGPVEPGLGSEIDRHDLVIRFNRCGNYGITGRRVDVLVLMNTGKPGKSFARAPSFIHPEARAETKSFWLARSPELVVRERLRRPEDRSHWATQDDALLRNLVGSRPWRYLDANTYWSTQNTLAEFGLGDADHPSTGTVVLFHIYQTMQRLSRPCRVTLYGFTHEGWSRHPWAAERALIDRWQEWVVRSAVNSDNS